MTTYDTLVKDIGPRGRRTLRRLSMAVTVVIAAGIALVVYGLYSKGELAGAKWELFAVWPTWKFLLGGLANTLKVAVVDGLIAISIGVLVALGQLSAHRVLRWPSVLYAEGFRSLPTLLLVLFAYFGLPPLGFEISAFWALVLGSAAYNSAALSNIFKAGIASLSRGQFQAASSLGMSYWVSMRYVIWPQAFRRMLPSTIAQFVVLLKDSSLGFFIGYEELLRQSEVIGSYSNNFLQSYLVVGVIYILLCYGLRRLALHIGDMQASTGAAQSSLPRET